MLQKLLDLILVQRSNMIKKKIFFIFFYFFFQQSLFANDNIYFIDLDFILKNSNLGKKIVNELNEYNSKLSDELETKQKVIFKNQDEINKTKNLISEEVLKEKIVSLQNLVEKFNEEKKQLSNSYNKLKIEKINNFYNQINPLIQKYMSNKSINILFDKKNIFIGSNEYDITRDVLDIINNEIK